VILVKTNDLYTTDKSSSEDATDRQIGSTKRIAPVLADVARSIAENAQVSVPNISPSVGRYELIREIGRGGYGIVYLAKDAELGRKVAIKIARREMVADEAGIQRFRQESRAAAALEHPGIISVFDCGEKDGLYFYVMPFLDSQNLAEWLSIQTEPLGEHTAAQLILEIADAIHFGHRQGIIHRDLKPQNILLNADPSSPIGFRPVVLDFGLCGLIDSANSSTSMLVGTPRYMSPEQAMFGFRRVTVRSDIYSLGVILYELLTRQTPHQPLSLTEAVLMLHGESVKSPRLIRSSLSAAIESICLKCLRKDQDRRYESAQALADDLRQFLAGTSIVARPEGLWERVDFAIRFGPWESRLGLSLIASNATIFAWSTMGALAVAWKFSDDPNVTEGFSQLIAFLLVIPLPHHCAGMYLGRLMTQRTQHFSLLTIGALVSAIWAFGLWYIAQGEPVPMRIYQNQGFAQVMVFSMVAIAFTFQTLCLTAGAWAAYCRKRAAEPTYGKLRNTLDSLAARLSS